MMTLEKKTYSAILMILSLGKIIVSILLVLNLCMVAQAENLINNGDFETPPGGGAWAANTVLPGGWINSGAGHSNSDVYIDDYGSYWGTAPNSDPLAPENKIAYVAQSFTYPGEMAFHQDTGSQFTAGKTYTLQVDIYNVARESGRNLTYFAFAVQTTGGVEIAIMDETTNPEVLVQNVWHTITCSGVAPAEVDGQNIEVTFKNRDGWFIPMDNFSLTTGRAIGNVDFDEPSGGGSYHKPDCAPGPWCNTDPLDQGGDCGIAIGDYTGNLGPSPSSGGQCCLVGQVDNTSHNEMYQTLSETFEAGMKYTLLFDMHDNGVNPAYWAVSLRGAVSGIEVARADQASNPEVAGGSQWFTIAALGVAESNVSGEQMQVYVGPRDGSQFLAYDSFRVLTEFASASHQYDLTVDQSQSQLTFSTTLASGFGGDSDSDTSNIVGSMKVNLTPESRPFNRSRITEIIWDMVDSNLQLSMTGWYFGVPIVVTIEGNNLGLRMGPTFAGSAVGGSCTVSYPGGTFNQTGNKVKGTGSVTYGAYVLGSDTIFLDQEAPFDADFPGTLVDDGSIISVTVPFDVTRVLISSGTELGTLRIHGVVVGTANTHTSKSYLASDLNTSDAVNLEDFALFVGQWLRMSCNPDNGWCERGDINQNGYVNRVDLDRLAGDWLDTTGQ